MALAFLPLAAVRPTFQAERNNSQPLIAQYPAYDDFMEYIWVNYVQPESLFPIRLWNCFDRNIDSRTNNNVESWHSKWNKSVQVAHPNLWTFLT